MEEKIILPITLRYDERDRDWTAECKPLGITEMDDDGDEALDRTLLAIRLMFQSGYGSRIEMHCMPVSQKFEVRILPVHDRTLDEFQEVDEKQVLNDAGRDALTDRLDALERVTVHETFAEDDVLGEDGFELEDGESLPCYCEADLEEMDETDEDAAERISEMTGEDLDGLRHLPGKAMPDD